MGRSWRLLVVVFAVGILAGSDPALATGLFSKKKTASPVPNWCFCARVCARFRRTPPPGFVPQGQSLASCPQINDELVYDNQVKCGCNKGKKNDGAGRTSPNH